MPNSEAAPVVTVTRIGADGTLVRWFRSVPDAQRQRAVLTVTSAGVRADGFLDAIPESWVTASREAHAALTTGSDVTRFATHRHQGPENGPLVPVKDGGDSDA